jgi:hypothetical protein
MKHYKRDDMRRKADDEFIAKLRKHRIQRDDAGAAIPDDAELVSNLTDLL